MPGIVPLAPEDPAVPDVFIGDLPCQLTEARTFFRLKHLAAWGAEVSLHPWDTWDRLGERLGARLGLHVWHPAHFDQYYETLEEQPASTPGAVPLTMQMVREKRREAKAQLALLAETVDPKGGLYGSNPCCPPG